MAWLNTSRVHQSLVHVCKGFDIAHGFLLSPPLLGLELRLADRDAAAGFHVVSVQFAVHVHVARAHGVAPHPRHAGSVLGRGLLLLPRCLLSGIVAAVAVAGLRSPSTRWGAGWAGPTAFLHYLLNLLMSLDVPIVIYGPVLHISGLVSSSVIVYFRIVA